MSGLYTSLENAEAATKSCESAVLIEVAKILQRKIPAIKAGNNPLRDSINTCSRSASERELFKYAFPMVPTMRATAMAIITQNIAILLDNFTSSLDRIAINLTRMWAYQSTQVPAYGIDNFFCRNTLSFRCSKGINKFFSECSYTLECIFYPAKSCNSENCCKNKGNKHYGALNKVSGTDCKKASQQSVQKNYKNPQ